MPQSDWVGFRDPKIGTTAEQISERCGWQMRGTDGDRRVCTNENYAKSSPNLVVARRLIDARGADDAALEDLTEWGHDDLYRSLMSSVEIDAEVARLTDSGSREGGWSAHLLLCAGTEPGKMPGYLRSAFEALCQPELFPDLSIWSVKGTSTAQYRHQIVRSLIAAEHLPEVIEDVKLASLSIKMASGLSSQSVGLPVGERLGPLLACSAPWITGFASERIGGAIVFMLGKLEFGKVVGQPHGDLIDQLQPNFLVSEQHGSRSKPEFSSGDAVDALQWWVRGLNALNSVELDPATHSSNGTYDPIRHWTTTLTIDRLVATIQQISIADRRSSIVRKLLFFDSLDLLEGLLRGHRFEVLTSVSKARKQLAELEEAMPSSVRRVLLPRCRRAVDALEEMRNGFWVPSTVVDGKLLVSSRSGQQTAQTFETATTKVLRMIRNGHHGLVSDRFHADSESRTMLTLHDGRIPDALPDIAFFHLVRLIAFADLLDPARLRDRRSKASVASNL
jgi:hypothetical protein